MPTPRDVLEKFRLEVDDAQIPGDGIEPDQDSLWKDAEIYGYMDEAQALLARRAFLLTGNLTANVVAGDPLVALPGSLVKARRVKLQGQRQALALPNMNELAGAVRDDYGSAGVDDWESVTGVPRAAIADHTPDSLRLFPIPTEDGVLEINAFVEPEEVICGQTAELALTRREHIRAMLLWMKKLAYEKHDADAMDLQRARGYELQFENTVAYLKSEHRRRTRRPGTVRYGGL